MGQEFEAVVIDIDKNAQRISLGMKQIEEDPWKGIETRCKIGERESWAQRSAGAIGRILTRRSVISTQ